MRFISKALKLAPLAATVAIAFSATGAWAQEVVKIGFTGPLSGGAALYGKNALNGMNMAVNEINAQGLTVAGKKYKLEVVALDDKYAPSEAAINARRLRHQHKVPAVFVPHSGGAFALQAFNERENFLLMAYTSVPAITARGNKLTMRIPPNFETYIDPFIRYQMKKGVKNLGMAPADHDYAKTWQKAFEESWVKAGGKVVSKNPMSYNKSADFYTGVSRVMETKPDVMFIGGPSEPTGLVIKQARELGYKGPFVLMDQAKMDEVARVTGGYGPLEGAIGTMPLAADAREGARDFVAAYRKNFDGANPTSESSLHYSSVLILASAMQLAGTVDNPAAIRAKLDAAAKGLPDAKNPNDFMGVDANGGSVLNTVIGVVEGGKIKGVRLKDL